MIEIPALIAILIAETLVVLVGFLIFQEYRKARKKLHDRLETRYFIDKINETQKDRLGELFAALIHHNISTDLPACRENLEEIVRTEKVLYRQFFDAFLNHDTGKIRVLDGMVRELTPPYLRLAKLLQEQTTQENDIDLYKERLVALESTLQDSKQELGQMKSHLALATRSLKDVSEEYTQMFGSYKGISDVEASLERMMKIFRRAERRADVIIAKSAELAIEQPIEENDKTDGTQTDESSPS